MNRAILFLLLGAAIGAAATYYLQTGALDSRSTRPGNSLHDQSRPPRVGTTTQAGTSTRFVAVTDSHKERETFYKLVAQADEDELLALIYDAAALPDPGQRRYANEILFPRYAESNPREAIELSRILGTGSSLTASLYAVWARTDADAALQAFQGEPNPVVAKTAGLFLVERLGGDETALFRVIDSLPPQIDELGFHIEVLAEKSRSDPGGAVSDATHFTDAHERRRALRRIARVMTAEDPQSAIAISGQIADRRDRMSFQNSVMREWAASDPSSVFDYVAAIDVTGEEGRTAVQSVLGSLAQADPERLMEFADRWSGQIAEQALHMAIRQWSQQDPLLALEKIDAQPRGKKRDRLLQLIAEGYARKDTDAALAWAENLSPRPQGIYAAVIGGIATEDPERAFDIALNLKSEADKREAVQGVAMRAVYQGGDAKGFADKVLALEDGQTREEALQMVGYMWANKDPGSAVDWLADNADEIPKNSFQSIARQIADSDPQLAADFTSRVPESARADWLTQVASGFAKADPDGAMIWISQYQSEPGYDGAVTAIAQQTAEHDPLAAARNIETLANPKHAAVIARTAGAAWARQDPVSAARWATTISNEDVRNVAVAGVARQWVANDVDAARQWVMTLPSGHARDNALTSVVAGVAAKGIPDDRLLNAFSTDMARQQAVVRAAYGLARYDRAAAERLIEKYVKDPTLRSQLDQNLSQILIN